MDTTDFTDGMPWLLWAALAWLLVVVAALVHAVRPVGGLESRWPRVAVALLLAASLPAYGVLEVIRQRRQHAVDAAWQRDKALRDARAFDAFCAAHPAEVAVLATYPVGRPVTLRLRWDDGAWLLPLEQPMPPPWLPARQKTVDRLQWGYRSGGGWEYDIAAGSRTRIQALDGPVVLSVSTVATGQPGIRQYRLALATANGQALGAATVAARLDGSAQPFCALPYPVLAELVERVLVPVSATAPP